MSASFEDLLARQGYIVYKTRGVSMKPMLRQNRDLVVIRVPVSRLKKYDVALYKRENAYILHRVIKVKDDHYLIRGDNTYTLETVPDESVIGVLSEFKHRGRKYKVSSAGYILYSRFWNHIYPLRFCAVNIRGQIVKILKKTGIMPYIKKMLEKARTE